ncbi:MAG TPA: Lsr2 family protein [Dermatophilaceae bacterium]|nr:Lsr2 family protein [Dermatophilaceae bacterium]
MAQRVQVLLVDDIDGTSDADETVTFALDGVTYEIDLSEDNAARLREDIAQWIGYARRSGGGRRSSRGSSRSASGGGGTKRKDLSSIREWARDHGHQVSDRGRISAAVQEAYDKAHG